MADEMTGPTMGLTADPFFNLTHQVGGVREKVSDSVFENYKLQVAQTNDVNNRAMQVALNKATALSALKSAASAATLQTMLAASRTDAAIGGASASQQRVVMEQGELTRGVINAINTQNLNTALININTALTGITGQYGGLGIAYGGAVSAVQSANQVNAVNSLGSALANNGLINTGTAGNIAQTATPTTIGN